MSPRTAVWIPAFSALLLAAVVVVTAGVAVRAIGQHNEFVRDQNEAVADAERALWSVRRIADFASRLDHQATPDDDLELNYLDTYRTLEYLLRPAGFLALAEDRPLADAIKQKAVTLAYRERMDAASLVSTAREMEPMLDTVRRVLWARKRDSYVDYYQTVQATVHQLNWVFVGAGAAALLGALPLAFVFGARLQRRAQGAADAAQALAGPSVRTDDPFSDLSRALRVLGERLRDEGAGGRLVDALDEERRRIALDMHDQVLTELTQIIRVTEALEADVASGAAVGAGAARNVRDGLTDLAADIRAVIDDLYPPVIETLGLEAALEGHIERLHARFADIRIGAAIEGGCAAGLPREAALAIYRIAREGLANALRHAGADRIDVDLHRDGDTLSLGIEDNGAKVAGDGIPAFTEGRGLAGIRHRAVRLGGAARWTRSRFSSGTRLTVEVPL